MKVCEMRERVRDLYLNASDGSHSDGRVDRAFIGAANRCIQIAPRMTQTSSSLDLTAQNPELSLSSLTNFRRDRFMFAQCGYDDEGTWTSGTAYVVGDLVTGDGNPNAYFYRCTTAHTASGSNEPGSSGGSSYWTRVAWKEGWRLQKVDYASMSRLLSDGGGYEHAQYVGTTLDYSTSGTPSRIALQSDTKAFVWPVPDAVYTVKLFWTRPLELTNASGAVKTWEPGNPSVLTYTISIPDEYIDIAVIGAAAILNHADPSKVYQSEAWGEMLRQAREAAMRLAHDTGMSLKNPEEYA